MQSISDVIKTITFLSIASVIVSRIFHYEANGVKRKEDGSPNYVMEIWIVVAHLGAGVLIALASKTVFSHYIDPKDVDTLILVSVLPSIAAEQIWKILQRKTIKKVEAIPDSMNDLEKYL